MKSSPDWILEGLPAYNARTVISARQARAVLAGLAILLGLFLWRPAGVFFWSHIVVFFCYLVFCNYKLVMEFFAFPVAVEHRVPVEPPDGWPDYCIMVPLYHEVRAVPGLCEHLATMDYPPDRLQVVLLVEEDDWETAGAVRRMDLPSFFDVVTVPDSFPKTKPKACNYGLQRCRGEFLVVYDAEDRPERDQLKKAVDLFARSPENTVCLQAELSFYNRDRNLLTRLFTAEYACWYRLVLRALHVFDAPIPLGGTSNHFRLPELLALKGWDPFNVTEDCDLGVRLYIEGKRTGMLSSTTWEEATFRIRPWIRQRSRWVKGYVQTYLVHLRQHDRLMRRMGLSGVLHFHLIFGANGFCLLVNPFYWLIFTLSLAGYLEAMRGFFPPGVIFVAMISLVFGNVAFIVSAMMACLASRNHRLIPYCLLMPFYWVLMSVGAYKGIGQLITKPFFWEKSPHECVRALRS